ncbi:MAG: hypothetical protein M3Z35_08045 [Nitrospirota bacterium]|nr:hypothetical protein [Nitrospirota bacterium]
MLKTTLVAVILAATTIQGHDSSVLDPTKQTVSISVDTPVLVALVKLGTETHTPMGIVLNAGKSEKLCEEHRHASVQDRPMSEFLRDILAQSNYAWTLEEGVIVIKPVHLTDQVSRVLNMKFDKFGGMQMTMQARGVILTGWIYSRLHPGAGIAGDILSSPDAEQLSMDVRNASVEQILNRIVSLGSKGIWFFQLRPDFEHNKDIDVHTYAYRDDAPVLQTICSGIGR